MIPLNDLQIAERRQWLRVRLAQRQFTSIHDLAQDLGVAPMTIRRDLRALQDAGLFPADAGVPVADPKDPSSQTSPSVHAAEKYVIAKESLALIQSHMTIALSAGTTTWTLAQMIRGFDHLSFITNSPQVALTLRTNGWDQIIMTGGSFLTRSDALVGPLAEQTLLALHSDLVFLGVHGLSADSGLSTSNGLESSLHRVFMNRSDQIAIVADHSKWGIHALAQFGQLEDADVLITDDGGGLSEIEAVRRRGLSVRVATIRESGPERPPSNPSNLSGNDGG